jgi:hypothetical protein
MNANQRFCLNERHDITDRLDPTVEVSWPMGFNEDEVSLREGVLWLRLADLVDALIINTNPLRKLPNGEEYQPQCEESQSVSSALYSMIKASQLNTIDVALSVQHRFGGKLKREKLGWQDFTSLSLFVDDVERLLRDLYGELDNQTIDRVRHAALSIVQEFTKYLRKDLWQEHEHAQDIDYVVYLIGVPEGCAIHGSDHSRMNGAAYDLELRARAVRTHPESFSKYTVEFVNELFSHWPSLNQPVKDLWRSEQVQLPKDFPFWLVPR